MPDEQPAPDPLAAPTGSDEVARLRAELEDAKQSIKVLRINSESILKLAKKHATRLRELERGAARCVCDDIVVARLVAINDDLNSYVHELTSDEGDDDALTVLKRHVHGLQEAARIAQNAAYDKTESLRNAQLVEALQALYDHQNGCPVPSWERGWKEAMRLAANALHKNM